MSDSERWRQSAAGYRPPPIITEDTAQSSSKSDDSEDSDFEEAVAGIAAVASSLPAARVKGLPQPTTPRITHAMGPREKKPLSGPMDDKHFLHGVSSPQEASVNQVLSVEQRTLVRPGKTPRGLHSSPHKRASQFHSMYHEIRQYAGFSDPHLTKSAKMAYLHSCVQGGLPPLPAGVVRQAVTTFSVGGASLGHHRAPSLSSALERMDELEELSLRGSRLGSGLVGTLRAVTWTPLLAVDLSFCQMSPPSIKHLCSGLKVAENLHTLSLESCSLSPAGSARVVRALQRSKHLRRLVLRRNSLPDCIALELAGLLVGRVAAEASLDALRSFPASAGAGHIASADVMHTVSAVGIADTDDGTAAGALPEDSTAIAARKAAQLELDIGWNSFSPTGTAVLIRALADTQVATLDLSHNSLASSASNVGVLTLADFLAGTKSLKHLNLGHAGLRLSHGLALSQALSANTTLTGLHMGGNELNIDARGFVIPAFIDHPSSDSLNREATDLLLRSFLRASAVPGLDASDDSRPQTEGGGQGDAARGTEHTPLHSRHQTLEEKLAEEARTQEHKPILIMDGKVTLHPAITRWFEACAASMGHDSLSASERAIVHSNEDHSLLDSKAGCSGDVEELIKASKGSLTVRAEAMLRALGKISTGIAESRCHCWACGCWRPFTFKYQAPVSGPVARQHVMLVTSFDNWVPQLMQPLETGSTFTLDRMVPSRAFFFCFIVDGKLRAGMDMSVVLAASKYDRSAGSSVSRVLEHLSNQGDSQSKGYLPAGVDFLNMMQSPLSQLQRAVRTHRKATAAGQAGSSISVSAASALADAGPHQVMTMRHQYAKGAMRRQWAAMESRGKASTSRSGLRRSGSGWGKLSRSMTKLAILSGSPTRRHSTHTQSRTRRLSMVALASSITSRLASPTAGTAGSSSGGTSELSQASRQHAQDRTRQEPISSFLPQRPGTLLASYEGGVILPRQGGDDLVGGYKARIKWSVDSSIFKGAAQAAAELTKRSVNSDFSAISSRLQALLKSEAAVEAVKAVVEANYAVIVSMFKFYCLAGAGRGGAKDFFNVSWGGMRQLVADGAFCSFAADSRGAVTPADVDCVFIASDVKAETGTNNPYRALCRHEFIEATVRLSLLLFPDFKGTMRGAEALEACLAQHLRPACRYDRLVVDEGFRETTLWTEEVDLTIKQYLPLLKKLYGRFHCPPVIDCASKAYDGMDMISWIHLLELSGILGSEGEGLHVSEHDAKVAFNWSKGLVEDEQAASSSHRVLTLLEFFEAQARMAMLLLQDPAFAGVPFLTAFIEVLELTTALVDETSESYLDAATTRALRQRSSALSLRRAGIPVGEEAGRSSSVTQRLTAAVAAGSPDGEAHLTDDLEEQDQEDTSFLGQLADLRAAFHEADEDESGLLSPEETLRLLFDGGVPEHKALAIMEFMDSDGDGEISFNEFMTACAQLV